MGGSDAWTGAVACPTAATVSATVASSIGRTARLRTEWAVSGCGPAGGWVVMLRSTRSAAPGLGQTSGVGEVQSTVPVWNQNGLGGST
jgi:hypothetical protein